MGIDSTNIPENIRQCMPQEARKAMNAPTSEEVGERVAVKLEKELHDQFLTWCTMKDLEVTRSRMDRRSTIEKGKPDFEITRGFGDYALSCSVELKRPGGRTSIDQEKVIWRMKQRGIPVAVCDNLADAIRFTLKALKMKGDA
jgi:hypothetical protein